MTIDLSAINAAAEALKQQRAGEAQPKREPKRETSAASTHKTKRATKSATKSAPKTDTPKTKDGASYVIPAEFKEAIEAYLYSRPDIIDNLVKPDKSIDGCCDYIFSKMLKVAKKNRNGKSAVGIFRSPEEIYSMAVHYYDESDEDLKNEKVVEGSPWE